MGDSIAGAYAALAGTEIVNNARTFEYLKNGLGPGSINVYGDCGCSNLFDVIGCFPPLVELDQYVDLPGTAGNFISTPDTPENSLQGTAQALRVTGHSGTSVTTPDSVALSIAGDIDIRVEAAADNWTEAGDYFIYKRSTNSGYGFRLHSSGNGALEFIWGDGATNIFVTNAAPVPFTAGQRGWVRVAFTVANRSATFYTSLDGTTWTPLGAPTTPGAVTTIADSANVVSIGSDGGSAVFVGFIYKAQILNGINNIVVANPDFTTTPWIIGDIASTARADSLGNVWTLQGNASIVAQAERRSLRLSGASTIFASAPDAAALDIVGDIDLRWYGALDDWTPAGPNTLVSKFESIGNQRSYILRIPADGRIQLILSPDGISNVSAQSTVATGIADGAASWIRATWTNATDQANFYTSTDGITWNLLGTANIALAATGIFNSTALLTIGAEANNGSQNRLTGNTFKAEVRNGINGTIVANPDFTSRPWDVGETSGATGADAAGNTWTLNGAGSVIQRAFASNLDVLIKLSLADWTPAVPYTLFGKLNTTGNQRAWRLHLNAGGNISFTVSPAGTTSYGVVTWANDIVDGETIWIRFTYEFGTVNNTANLYTSTDGINWVLKTTGVGGNYVGIFDSTALVEIGSFNSGANESLDGNIYYAELRNGIDGVIVASFDANDTEATSATTPNTVTSSRSGEVWTINGAGWMWGNGAYTFPNFPYTAFPGYVSPTVDSAPWFSADSPASAGFLGFVVDEFEGLDSPFSRSVQQSIGNGGVLSRARLSTREMTWRGFLFGESCCSVQYGLRWLTQTLSRFNSSCLDCQGDDLELLICCPDDALAATGAESPFRTLKGVGLLEGPTIVSERKTCSSGCSSGCGGSCILEIEFTLVATQPYFYSPPIPVYDCVNLSEGSVTPATDAEADCGPFDCSDVIFDVGGVCPQPPLPPTAVYMNSCLQEVVQPLANYYTVSRSLWKDLDEVVPVISITTGTLLLHQISLGFFTSPNDNPCGDLTLFPPDCDVVCDNLTIFAIPANSTFYIDGRTRKMAVICPDGSAFPGERLTSGPWSWPAFSCYGFCMEILFDGDDNPAAELTCVSLSLVPRTF